ncbi:pyridoxamine 5'-phosphate oxidase family protein [Clostridium felsineum]|uniref:pyridoxamine 5'-phosphate oxidase family protein n=1 Tax=Clostridium felsineum TaxID=36839 RepID=UPI00098BF3FC|nr:pyridoxamine 5'-phosphate oxidase family protein [Clostridium felsineum]URZ16193.1 hypothetical protein CLFE_022400 [Clostridium felsineum DSM 794]
MGDGTIKNIIFIYDDCEKGKKIAFASALITGNSRYSTANKIKEEYKKFDYICFIIGKLDESIEKFVTENNGWIRSKKIILIYFDYENVKLKAKKIFSTFNDVLEKEFIIKQGTEDEYLNFAMEIKDLIDTDYKKCPDNLLIKQIGDFLYSHTTCTLCSCSGSRPIGTPIEYMYKSGYMYFITEGGRKFFNIIRNNKVIISVYEDYKGFNKLNGYQFFGVASILEDNSEEYKSVITMKKLNVEAINSINVMLHVIKVKLERVDIISSDIKKKGYDVKQKYFYI